MKVYILRIVFAYLIFTAFLSFFCGQASSQFVSRYDSLTNELYNAKEDTQKVKLYLRLSDRSRLTQKDVQISPDSLIAFANEGLLLATKLNLQIDVARFYKKIGVAKIYNQEYDTSFYYLNKALDILSTNENLALESEIYLFGGVSYGYKGDYASAIDWLTKGLNAAKKIGDKENIYQNLFSLGSNYKGLNDYEKAIDSYERSLAVAEDMEDTLYIGRALQAMAGIYRLKRDNYEKALKFYEKSLEYLEKSNYKLSMGVALSNMGLIFYKQNQIQKAIDFTKRALLIFENAGKKDKIASTQNHLAKYYSKIGNYKEAHRILTKNYEYFSEIGAKPNIADNLHSMGMLYSNWGKYNKALFAFKGSYNVYDNLGQKYDLIDLNKEISKVYERQNNYIKALEYYKHYSELNNSFFDEKMTNQLNELEVRYKTKEKQQQIELQESRLAQQEANLMRQKTIKNLLFGGIGALFAFIMVVGYAYIIKKNANLRIKSQKEEIETQAEYLKESNLILQQKALSAQMNPHFIYNTLNSVQSYILKNQRESSSLLLSKLAKLMRRILENSQYTLIALSEEVDALIFYLEIEQERFKNSFDYYIEIDEKIDAGSILVPPLIIQPFVENSIHHGLRPMSGMGNLKIEISKRDESLYIVIDDNGIGRQKAKEKKHSTKSLGTEITQQRLNINSSILGEGMNVKYFDKVKTNGKSDGTKVEITLPLNLTLK